MSSVYVIKIGSSVFLDNIGINKKIFNNIVKSIIKLNKKGIFVVLVSSGAISLGELFLEYNKNNLSDFEYECMCASVGQAKLLSLYHKYFDKYNKKISQILLTYDDIQDLEKPFMIKKIIKHTLSKGIIPIINENNTVFRKGKNANNDKLSGFISEMLNPDKFILLGSVDGLFDSYSDKIGNLISNIAKIEDKHYNFVSNKFSNTGRGGIKTKLDLAEKMIKLGIPMYFVNGHKKGILNDIYNDDYIGTYFGK